MKRYIHSSSDYTDLISDEIPEPVVEFLNTSDEDIISDYSLVKDAVDAYNEEYELIPYNADNIIYDEDKGRFYSKYRGFADSCKRISKMINPSGYGKKDYLLIQTRNLLKSVDFNFPYGWKYMVR